MIGPKIKGGLDLPDFEIMNNALVKTNNTYTKAAVMQVGTTYLVFKRQGSYFLLECNYDLICL